MAVAIKQNCENQKSLIQRRAFSSWSIYTIVLFLVNPFILLIVSLINKRQQWAVNGFWLFCIYFGFTFITNSTGPDSYRYAEKFRVLANSDLSLGDFIGSLYSIKNQTVDFGEYLISYVVSRFTGDSRFLFAAYGAVFGFFYSRNIWYLLRRINYNSKPIIVLYILTFALINPIWDINGVRFWTATQIYIYAVLPLLLEGKKKNIWLAFGALFMHFSFMFPIILLLIYVFIGNKVHVYFVLFVSTLFVNSLDLYQVKNILLYMPELFQGRVGSYISEDIYINQVSSIMESNWYVKYFQLFVRIIASSFLIIIYFYKRVIFEKDRKILFLYSFSLLFYIYANIAALAPAGYRFFTVGNLMVFFVIINLLAYKIKVKWFAISKIIFIPLLIIIILVSLRRGTDYMSILTFIGNPFIAPLFEGSTPIINFIK